MYHIWDAIFFLSGCLDCELKQGVSRRFLLHFIASHGNTFRFNRKDDAQKIPPGSSLVLWVGMVWVWVRDTEKKLGGGNLFLFFAFVIDTSQLHYSLVCV